MAEPASNERPRSMRDLRPVAQVLAAEGVARAIQLKHVASVLYTYR